MMISGVTKFVYVESSVIIESFIPKYHQKYVELNITYANGCKKYAAGIPEFLRDRRKQAVENLLDKCIESQMTYP